MYVLYCVCWSVPNTPSFRPVLWPVYPTGSGLGSTAGQPWQAWQGPSHCMSAPSNVRVVCGRPVQGHRCVWRRSRALWAMRGVGVHAAASCQRAAGRAPLTPPQRTANALSVRLETRWGSVWGPYKVVCGLGSVRCAQGRAGQVGRALPLWQSALAALLVRTHHMPSGDEPITPGGVSGVGKGGTRVLGP